MEEPIAPPEPTQSIEMKPQPMRTEIPLLLTPEEVIQLWRLEDIDLTPEQIKLLPLVQHWLGKRRENSLADLLVGKPIKEISRDITRTLTADVLLRFKPRSQGILAAALMTKIIDRGNRENITVSLCPPPIATLIKSQSSPFQIARWPTLELAGKLRTLLQDSLCQPVLLIRKSNDEASVARVAVGQMLVSAIVHGGLVAHASLTALLTRLNEEEAPMASLRDRLFIELSLSHRTQENAQFRRWFPDPLSAVLIMNTQSRSTPEPESSADVTSTASELIRSASKKADPDPDDLKKLIWPCIKEFIKSCNASKRYPNSLSQLLDAVRLDLESQIPIYLTHYAALSVVSHSLKPSVYRRIHGLQVESGLDKAEKETIERGLGNPGTGIDEDLQVSPEVEPRWLYSLRVALKGNDRGVIIHEINKLRTSGAEGFHSGDVGALFADFALRIFTTDNDNNAKMAVSTCKAYVFSVGTRLGGLIGHSISEFGAAEWTSLYEEALADSETPGVRRKLVRVLREFQRYLEIEHKAEPINSAEVFGIGAGLVPVDANIVTDQEFVAIRDRFAKGSGKALSSLTMAQNDDQLSESAWLILTLAYRCGLRRMEVLKIELVDVLLHLFPELLVRPNEYRRLKTKSSTRKMPLFALLNAEEIDRLKLWVQKRLEEEKISPFSNFLFALPQRNHIFIPQEGLFKLLHQVMREVTGDSSLRFHHLRHSFASRMFVLLAVTSTKCRARVISTLPGYVNAFDNSEQLRCALLGKTGTTRRLVWAVCCLLGHSGPDVSLEHYIHHLDIMLAEALTNKTIAPSFTAVTKAAEKSTSQAYRHREDESLDTWAAHLFKKHFNGESFYSRSQGGDTTSIANPKSSPLAAQENDATMSLYQIWEYLFQIKTSEKSIETLSQIHGVDATKLARYSANADWLFSLKTSEKPDSHRHRFMEVTPDLRYPEIFKLIAVPRKHHEERDRKVIGKLEAKFREIFSANKPLVLEVVETYALESREDFSEMIFKYPDAPSDAFAFLSFLKLLGLKNNQIKFFRYDLENKRSSATTKWRKALNIHSSIRIDRAPPIGGKKNWACPWIGIMPVFDAKDDQKMGSTGFRFFMVMVAIAILNKGVADIQEQGA